MYFFRASILQNLNIIFQYLAQARSAHIVLFSNFMIWINEVFVKQTHHIIGAKALNGTQGTRSWVPNYAQALNGTLLVPYTGSRTIGSQIMGPK